MREAYSVLEARSLPRNISTKIGVIRSQLNFIDFSSVVRAVVGIGRSLRLLAINSIDKWGRVHRRPIKKIF